MSLQNKTVFITGASSGIGAATAKAFARAGAKLILTARRIKRLETLSQSLKEQFGTNCYLAELDVRNAESVTQLLHALPKAYREIDILVNNAGLAVGLDKVQDAEIEDWDTMIDTNIKGLLYLTRAILPIMLAHDHGQIINVSSLSGHLAYSGAAVYCATKSAVRAFSYGLKLDCAGTPIRVTDVAPGMVETEFSQVRFKGDIVQAKAAYETFQPLEARDVAEAILFAASQPLHVNVSEIVLTATEQAMQLT